MATPLGMPAIPLRTTAPPWRSAWDAALYGPGGFFRTQSPADHFRTSVHGSDLMARALLTLLDRAGLDTLVDVGAGRGELLVALHRLDPTLELLGVEVAARPGELPAQVDWSPVLPTSVDGLVIAHEWLDNVPCHVVEVDDTGSPRVVHVDPATGEESLGHRVDADGVPATLQEWLAEWWPLDGYAPGTRAEVGTSRDRAWGDLVGRMDRGLAIAVDYGHLRADRPALGSLRSYLHGREVDVLPDGSRDVTAHVAVDALAAATGGMLVRQRDALAALGLETTRPPHGLAEADPAAYLSALERTTRAADLVAPGGLGDFWWVVCGRGGIDASVLSPLGVPRD
ncbi:SAM-dependent methyltransferase [Microbacterium sp.]|uniref:SAM-dependent methyltransferase n=1 Tax=Microbacterium sp. TaxID=51671 RepID=UPI003735F731